MQFEVRVIRDGTITSVLVEAISADNALRQAESQTQRALSARAVHRFIAPWASKRRTNFELLLFSQELLALLQAGLAIIEALDTLAEREGTGEIQSVLAQLSSRLREGKSFSDALETLPDAFPSLFIGMVRSSERTGDLQPALERYIDYRTRLNALRGKLVSAAIYPALLLVVGVAVTLFLGGYVVPRFAAVYQGAGRSLPWASSLLLEWGRFANDHLAQLALSLFAGGGTAIVLLRKASVRGGWSDFIGRLPFVGKHLRIYELSRMYLTLGMLLNSGLPIMRSLALAQSSLPLRQRTAIDAAAQRIRRGERLSAVFENTNLTTPVSVRMLRVGEESGRLGEMMTRTARFHEEEVARWIERFSRAAEPVLMVGIGLVVGTIVVLLYMPIFDLAGSLR